MTQEELKANTVAFEQEIRQTISKHAAKLSLTDFIGVLECCKMDVFSQFTTQANNQENEPI